MVNFGLLTAALVSVVAGRDFTFSDKSYTLSNETVYQSSYDSSTGSLFLSSASTSASNLIKFDVDSWKPVEYVTPYTYNGTTYNAYAIQVDEGYGTAWVLNGKESTIASYNTSDLSLIKQLPSDSVSSSAQGFYVYGTNVYVGTQSGSVNVFSTETYEKTENINLNATGEFGDVMQIVVDEDADVLYTVSLSPVAAAAVDLKNGNNVTIYDLGDDITKASGVAYDSKRGQLFVVTQGNNITVVVDTTTGEVTKRISTSATGLRAAYDPVNDLVYYASRTQGVTVVIDPETLEVIDELDSGTDTNHVTVGPDGTVYTVTHESEPPSVLHAYTPKQVSNSSSSSSAAASSSPSHATSSGAAANVTAISSATTNATASSSGSGAAAAVTATSGAAGSRPAKSVTANSSATMTADVTYFTTYCPSPTTFTHGSSTYTVTQATTLTIEDCGCTNATSASFPATSAPQVASGSSGTSAPVVANAANSLTFGVAAVGIAVLGQIF